MTTAVVVADEDETVICCAAFACPAAAGGCGGGGKTIGAGGAEVEGGIEEHSLWTAEVAAITHGATE